MKFNKYLSSMALACVASSCIASASDYTVEVDPTQFRAAGAAPVQNSSTGMYIVQLKGAPAIAVAADIGELTPSNQLVARYGNNYNANTPAMTEYVRTVKERQEAVASAIGVNDVLHSYAHTFNGFSAKLTPAQANALRAHPDVANVFADELHQLQTANTPAFLGLTGANGQHTLGIKGEDVVVGILDSGIWPENPSFSEDSSISERAYGAPPSGWNGECNVGSVGSFTDGEGSVIYDDATAPVDEFECNNKLIGARYFGQSFSSVYEIRFGLGEFASPRDADGHGSHTASTAAGNAGVTATLSGVEVGTVSGIAPRARVAAYKVCWNANFVSEAGVNERGCFFGDSMAAIDQAVVDGVDVLNYSIGNSQAINSPVYTASLRAAQAGVFFSGSAGNSGPTADTVSNIAPWITTVAASTYDGESALIGNALTINSGDLEGDSLFSIHSAIGPDVPEGGLTGDLGLASPILACDPITTDLTGQIALIARGACAFSTKMLNAQAAGAIGVVVYTDNRTPIAMGGEGAGINIPGVMVTNADGLALVDSVNNGVTNVTMTFDPAAGTSTEVGNIMANFSSRGVNTQSNDILKPDITAPGVRILAATSSNQFEFDGNVDGESFAYLQGTSMSSPHIAGMAALLSGQYPEWSPAQIKSALMTTAYQDVVKEDGATPATPFDFGAGHASPVDAMNPGVVYDANLGDYLGFLCGQGEDSLVLSLQGEDALSCAQIADAGFATDATELNYPSIAIGTLDSIETVSRTVTDVTGDGGQYAVVVDAPAGISVSVETFDSEGTLTEDNMLILEPNGTASYRLTFDRVANAFTPDQWVFGSVTLQGNNGIDARSPIAVFPLADSTIIVPESLSIQLNRGRAAFAVQTLYTGDLSMDYTGLVEGFGITGEAPNRNGGAFNFSAGLATSTFLSIPEGTSLARFALRDALVGDGTLDTNLDLYLYACTGFSCVPVADSTNVDSNEEIMLVNPEPKFNRAAGDLYILFVHGVDTAGQDSVDYTVPTWIVEGADPSTRMTTSRRAVEGRFHNVSLRTRGLNPDLLYMGTVSFTDDFGEVQGTTVLEVQP
ncbi:S8 family serine peptidase [Alteromonas oceanisediminis]|uniref:S8 family serine peptidase n=1 Tax=Alteromonas oceanisediminis TaxID=2836180 RepID=UPI001BDA2FF6|nr:S8 family serine peptidase [Alteromonas oceanisediminis]MBT0585477.1 S8 family serine peptidase [Alteromonas oceanisediminis]